MCGAISCCAFLGPTGSRLNGFVTSFGKCISGKVSVFLRCETVCSNSVSCVPSTAGRLISVYSFGVCVG